MPLIFFHKFQSVKSPPFHFPEAWKRYPFWAEPPHVGYYRVYRSHPPPPPEEWTANNVPKPNLAGLMKTAPAGSSRLKSIKKTLSAWPYTPAPGRLYMKEGAWDLRKLKAENSRPHHPPTSPSTPQHSTCLRGILSLVNGLQTLKESDMTNLRQTWRVHWLSQSKTNGQ